MNCPLSTRHTRTLFVQDDKLGLLEQQLFGHVLAAIDLDRISHLETSLFAHLTDAGLTETLALDLAAQLVEHALVRVATDADIRCCDFGPPEGITDAERRAVEHDDACPICVEDRAIERQRARSVAEPPPHEPCPCCEDLAQSWREEHAEELAHAGLTSACSKAS
jgi:hypothetical protein